MCPTGWNWAKPGGAWRSSGPLTWRPGERHAPRTLRPELNSRYLEPIQALRAKALRPPAIHQGGMARTPMLRMVPNGELGRCPLIRSKQARSDGKVRGTTQKASPWQSPITSSRSVSVNSRRSRRKSRRLSARPCQHSPSNQPGILLFRNPRPNESRPKRQRSRNTFFPRTCTSHEGGGHVGRFTRSTSCPKANSATTRW